MAVRGCGGGWLLGARAIRKATVAAVAVATMAEAAAAALPAAERTAAATHT